VFKCRTRLELYSINNERFLEYIAEFASTIISPEICAFLTRRSFRAFPDFIQSKIYFIYALRFKQFNLYDSTYIDAKWYPDKSACNLLTLLPLRLSVFLLNDSFILPAKHGLQSFSPFSYFLLSFGLIKLIELPLSN